MTDTKRGGKRPGAGRKPGAARSSIKRSTTLVVEDWPIERVTPYWNNPRRNEEAVKKTMASLKEFGWRQPIVVDRDGIIIVGHTRRLAAIRLRQRIVPVHVALDLTDAQIKAYRIADNRTGEDASWDDELLGGEIGELRELGFDLALTGFEPEETDRLLGVVDPEEPAAGAPALGDVEFQVVVTCADETAQGALCAELEKRGLKCRLLTL